MTVLFMIIAVIFSACPADSASGGDGDSSGDETEGPSNPDGVVITPTNPSNPGTGTTLEGDSLVLTVTVNNTDDPPESYQWYSNTVNSNTGGTAISGETKPSFTPPTEVVGTTYYYVVITLESGKEIKSDPYMVMVKEILTIQPNNDDPDETLEGEGLELEVKFPAGYTVVSYQWWRNSANNNTGGSAIEGATSAKFLPPTNVKGTTFYYVVVTLTKDDREIVKKSAPFRVTVVANDRERVDAAVPFITGQPQAAEYVQETTARALTVTYTVADTIRPDGSEEKYDSVVLFQWFKATSETAAGTAIEGADARLPSYTPSTMTVGVFYYYVEITNEIADDQYVRNRSGKAQSSRAKIEIKEGARKPEITSQPVSSDVIFGNSPTAMTIVASSPDGGQLSYQWWKTDSPVADGTAISGATAATYTPSASVNGNIDYYYCIVTNTKEILGENMTNTRKSDVVYVAVGVKDLTLTQLTVTPKDYDGTDAVLNFTGGTLVTTNVTTGDNVQLVQGTARFAQADAGVNIDVVLEGWYLAGAQKNKYRLVLPATLKGTINKANGSAVPVPVLDETLDFNPMSYKIVLKALGLTNPATRQVVEYAKAANATTAATALSWQTSPVFTGLTVDTDYYFYARSQENTNYKAGTQNVGDKYTTIPGSAVESVIVTGKTDSSITVTASLVAATGQTIEYNISKNFNGTDYILPAWQIGTGELGTTATLNNLEGGVPYYIYARSKATADWAVGGYTVSDESDTAHPRVTFVVNQGSSIASNINITNVREVLRGLKLANDSNIVTTRGGYDFDYWYEDANYTKPYNFNTTVLASFTLYARWVSQTVKQQQEQRDMLWINGGWFRMGNNADKGPNNSTLVAIEHDVGLTGFWMGRYEITQEEWVDIMEIDDPLKYPFTFKNAVANESETAAPGKLPAETINWYSALVFCNKKSSREGLTPAYMIKGSTNPSTWGTTVPTTSDADWNNVQIVAGANGYRLPTEAQWEYACRAGANPRTEYYGGDTINNDTGWYTANSNNTTHKIGLKPNVISQGNAWGLYDMHGNVAEWCWDKWGVFTSASAVNPSGPTTSTVASGYDVDGTSGFDRVVRGGGYSHAAALLRSSYRTPVNGYGTGFNYFGIINAYCFYPYSSYAYVGLRLVRP